MRTLMTFSFFLCIFCARAQSLPPGMTADSLHAPWYHGVASGDPLPGGVIIWSRITPAPGNYDPYDVQWAMYSDSLLTAPVQSGTVQTDSSRDWTVKVDVSGLQPDRVYYYSFADTAGNRSATGRTRTAPSGNVQQLRFAVFSCSSIYSGYFNAYARIAEKSATLNAAIHLGDYLYDFVDDQEQIRVPSPFPVEPQNLEEWRDRHEYYLLDPDLRRARQSLPWIVIWDNHDMKCSGSSGTCDTSAVRAFMEWLPVREPDPSDPSKIYRSFSFGGLADIFMTDVLVHRNKDLLPGGAYNMLGSLQYSWLKQQLSQSQARWKIMGNQRMMGGWYTNGIPQWLLDMVPNEGAVFDYGSWDGFPETRDSLFSFLASGSIDNFIALSGDAHVSITQDLTTDPFSTGTYDPATGNGSAGVEFLPTSISRGNLDESGAPPELADALNQMDLNANPQHRYADLFRHGYGIIDLRPDSALAEFWYSDILSPAAADTLAKTMIVLNGENHWKRGQTTGLEKLSENMWIVYPNPTDGEVNIAGEGLAQQELIKVYNMLGELVAAFKASPVAGRITIDMASLRPGIYLVEGSSILRPLRVVLSSEY